MNRWREGKAFSLKTVTINPIEETKELENYH